MQQLRSQLEEAGWQRDEAAAQCSRVWEEAGRLAREKDEAATAHKAELGRLPKEHQRVAAEKDEVARKAAEEVTQLRADRDCNTGALAAREQQLLGEALYIDELLTRKCFYFLSISSQRRG